MESLAFIKESIEMMFEKHFYSCRVSLSGVDAGDCAAHNSATDSSSELTSWEN